MPASGYAPFPTTRWTVIISAQADTSRKRQALAELLGIYWQPLYCWARRNGRNPSDAQDAVQGFVAHLLKHDFLARLDPSRGRLRGFLKTAFANFLGHEYEKRTAAKRGGHVVPISIDLVQAEHMVATAADDPEQAFVREWANGVMARALARLAQEFASGQRGGPFALVQQFFGAAAAPSYQEAARSHGMSVPQLKAFLHRTRVRFRDLVRDELADTVPQPADVDAELSELVQALS